MEVVVEMKKVGGIWKIFMKQYQCRLNLERDRKFAG